MIMITGRFSILSMCAMLNRVSRASWMFPAVKQNMGSYILHLIASWQICQFNQSQKPPQTRNCNVFPVLLTIHEIEKQIIWPKPFAAKITQEL